MDKISKKETVTLPVPGTTYRVPKEKINVPDDIWSYDIQAMDIKEIMKYRRKYNPQDNPVLQKSASKYNTILTRSAFCEKELFDLERFSFYLDQDLPGQLKQEFELIDKGINSLYRRYDNVFNILSEDEGTGVEKPFNDECKKLEKSLLRFEKMTEKTRLKLAKYAEGNFDWVLPERLGRQPRSMPPFSPDGKKMNRLLYGVWGGRGSYPKFDESKEEELEFNISFYSYPGVFTDEKIDFSNIANQAAGLKRKGFSTGCMAHITASIYCPDSFILKHKSDPEIISSSWDGLLVGGWKKENNELVIPPRTWAGQPFPLNYYHPEVRKYIREYVSRLSDFVKNNTDMLFYEYAQEFGHVMGVGEKRLRRNGGGLHATNQFKKYLEKKYKTIKRLNNTWQTTYLSFEDIKLPRDPLENKPTRKAMYTLYPDEVTPLYAEFEEFREKSNIEYFKLIYDSIKKTDPQRPVVSRHSNLIKWLNGARMFETCDILSAHLWAPEMKMYNVYLSTLSRYNDHKPLAYMEDFWGIQEEKERIGDERIQRRGLSKHMHRTAAWGRTMQMKWYLYTPAVYCFKYNGNWMHPKFGFTTLRYCAPALITGKRSVEKVDWMLTHSYIVPSRIAVLQPSDSMRLGASQMKEFLAVHSILYPKNYLYELLPEEYLMNGKAQIKEFDVIVLPNAKYLARDIAEKILRWVKKGGTLVALGKSGFYNDLGIRDDLLAKTILKIEDTGEFSSLFGDEFYKRESLGKGKIIWIRSVKDLKYLRVQAECLREIDSSITRNAWAKDDKFEVLKRIAEDGGVYLFVLNPDPDNKAVDTVIVPEKLKTVVDISIPGGCPVPFSKKGKGENTRTSFKIQLGPCEAAFLYLGGGRSSAVR